MLFELVPGGFLISNKLEQFKLEKKLGFRNMQEKLEKCWSQFVSWGGVRLETLKTSRMGWKYSRNECR